MNCIICGHKMKKVKSASYHYISSGLSRIYLQGIEEHECTNKSCGDIETSIPNIEELHNVIATNIASQTNKLLPEEIRFLRTHLGFSGTDFADHVGVSAESVSRWESGSVNMKEATEKLLRVLILSKTGPFNDYDELKGFAKIQRKTALKRTFRIKKSHWREDTAA